MAAEFGQAETNRGRRGIGGRPLGVECGEAFVGRGRGGESLHERCTPCLEVADRHVRVIAEPAAQAQDRALGCLLCRRRPVALAGGRLDAGERHDLALIAGEAWVLG